MRLYGYFRSSASWRVRIALALKGLAYTQSTLRLREGEQRSAEYLAINPQGLVPALELDDGRVLTQSLAICEYLEEIAPEPPLLPADAYARGRVRALAELIAMDIHPIQNLKVLQRVDALGGDRKTWGRTVIAEGLGAYEQAIASSRGRFSWGDAPTLADICLVPQLGNARRVGVALDRYPAILAVETACNALPAFSGAVPAKQPDAAD